MRIWHDSECSLYKNDKIKILWLKKEEGNNNPSEQTWILNDEKNIYFN